MKKINLILVLLMVILAGCDSQGPISVNGTLPIVTGLTLREEACRGDTLVFTWDSVSVEVDGFGLWFSESPDFMWIKAGDFSGRTGMHVVNRCFTYGVWAQRGNEHSAALSNRVTVGTLALGTAIEESGDRIAGFAITPDTILGGNATNPDFRQDFFIRRHLQGYLLYAGHTDPRMCPGGRWAQLAPAGGDGFRAPHPDSDQWSDSLYLFSSPRFFIMLENGHYGRFTAMVYESTVPDPDPDNREMLAEVSFVLQPIQRVRLFD